MNGVTHSGTHIDAPDHMLESGSSLDNIEIDRFVGQDSA
ncbi:cyclase family protein [Thermoplasma sp. Kam2015]|nr:cyclase family protein [Thermoplasma sp. Kam2015]